MVIKKDKKVFKYKTRWGRSPWCLYRTGINSSLISSFLNCREHTRLQYIEGLQPITPPLYFVYGTLVHWVLEHCYKVSAFTEPAVVKMIDRYTKSWLSSTGGRGTGKHYEDMMLAATLAKAELPCYFRYWRDIHPPTNASPGQFPKHKSSMTPTKWVALETSFSVPWEFNDGTKTNLVGTWDGVFLDAKNALWGFDTKCRSVVNEEETEDTLDRDIQFMFYAYAMVVMADQDKFQDATDLGGFILNIVRRPGIYRRKDEPLKEYGPRVKAAVEKNPGHYFIRFKMDLTSGEVRRWARTWLRPVLEDLRSWWEGESPHYYNPNALVTKYGRSPYYQAIVRGDLTNYVVTPHRYGSSVEQPLR